MIHLAVKFIERSLAIVQVGVGMVNRVIDWKESVYNFISVDMDWMITRSLYVTITKV